MRKERPRAGGIGIAIGLSGVVSPTHRGSDLVAKSASAPCDAKSP
jgi:hypothetical protein